MTRSCRLSLLVPLTRLDLLYHVAFDSVHPPRVPIQRIDVSPLFIIYQQPTRAYKLTTMFGEEIARIRKLGVQGVSARPCDIGCTQVYKPASLPGSQLPKCRRVRSDDVESSMFGHQLRLAYSGRPLVKQLPFSHTIKLIQQGIHGTCFLSR